MQTILNFFSDTLVMNWLFGEEILELFNTYFLSQSDANKVLIIVGLGILSVIGGIQVVKWLLKVTLTWAKVLLFIGLVYYVFVVVLNIDIWALFGI